MSGRHLDDVAATEAAGAALAHALGEAGAVIHLQGPLGSGKTTLVRGFLHALGHSGPVRSPTYTLVEPYAIAGRDILHLDLYRINAPDELESLGLREAAETDAVWLVEWPERGTGHLPAADLVVVLDYDAAGRRLGAEAFGPRGDVLLRALFPSD